MTPRRSSLRGSRRACYGARGRARCSAAASVFRNFGSSRSPGEMFHLFEPSSAGSTTPYCPAHDKDQRRAAASHRRNLDHAPLRGRNVLRAALVRLERVGVSLHERHDPLEFGLYRTAPPERPPVMARSVQVAGRSAAPPRLPGTLRFLLPVLALCLQRSHGCPLPHARRGRIDWLPRILNARLDWLSAFRSSPRNELGGDRSVRNQAPCR